MASSEQTIKVGFVSGFNSPYGIVVKNQFKGAQLAVEEVNKAGGVLGRTVVLIEKDDQMKVDLAAAITKELIEKDTVDLLIGTLSAATAIEANKVARAAGIPFICVNQVNAVTNAENLGPYTFHEGFSAYMNSQLAGKWGFEHLGKRWFFMVPDYTWGYESYESYQIILKKLGGEDLGVAKVPLGAKEEDYAKHFPEILKLKPDVLAVTNFGSDQINFIRATHKAGIKKEISTMLTLSDIAIAEVVGPEELVGMYWGTHFYWGIQDHIPSAKKFVTAFRERFDGEYPTGYAGYAYSATLEFLTAAEAAGGYPIDYNKMAKFLEGRTYDHYKGKQWWRPCDHQSFQDLYMLKFKGPEEATHKYDIGEILGTVPWDLEIERSCESLGHGGHQWGHIKE